MNASRLSALIASLLVLGACGISTDDAPRNIPAADQRPLGVDTLRNVGVATGSARVYLLSPDAVGQAQSLVAVARDVEQAPDELLAALFDGPNSDEVSRQLRTALPPEIELRSSRLQGGVLRLDVSEELLQLSGQVLVAAVAQMVFTASELRGVRSVSISVDGAEQQWPSGNGDLQSAPLTVYDYPGFVQSSQPAFPAIPSPAQS